MLSCPVSCAAKTILHVFLLCILHGEKTGDQGDGSADALELRFRKNNHMYFASLILFFRACRWYLLYVPDDRCMKRRNHGIVVTFERKKEQHP